MSDDRILPAVVGPITGPAVTVIDGPLLTRRPDAVAEKSGWSAPAPASRRLTDLPESQAWIAPGLKGLFASLFDSWTAAHASELQSKLAPYTPYTSPDTPADAAHFNIAQIVVKFVEGCSVRLDGAKLVVTEETKHPA